MTNNVVYGWCGKILKIDLTTKKSEVIPLNIDEFSPENPIIFGAGPFLGTLIPAANKFTVTTKSPLSNIFADATAGGYFGPELKFAGFDQVIITGASDNPVYILIDDGDVEIVDAKNVWGTDTWTTQKEIKRQHGDSFQIACIGQAGENLIRFAGVIHGLKRAAGKFGVGAVMGSKKLKAVAVRGTKGVKLAHPEMLVDFVMETQEKIKSSVIYKTRSVYGTPYIENVLAPLGAMSTRNFRSTSFEHYKDIGGIKLTEEYSDGMRSCMGCGAHCTHVYTLKEGPYKGVHGEGPEFTLTSMCGDRCGISDLEALLKINQLTNEYGMDCAAFGGLIGWAMDCYERGIIGKSDTDGLELNFGNAEAVIELAHNTAHREGFGAILAEGEKRAPQLVGRGSEKYMHHVKGGIVIAEEPRALIGFGLAYLTSTRGSDHLRAGFSIETHPKGAEIAEKLFGDREVANPRNPRGKGKGVKWFEDFSTVIDALGLCKFNYRRMFDDMSEALDAILKAYYIATGITLSLEELLSAGERIYNVEKAFNVRLGQSRKDDNFSNPEKFLKEP
jgi:aldehyde:ferredoxin oxidoreductase